MEIHQRSLFLFLMISHKEVASNPRNNSTCHCWLQLLVGLIKEAEYDPASQALEPVII